MRAPSREASADRRRAAVKRLIDVSGAAIGLSLLAPLLLLVAVSVRCTSRGPAFFVQERVGRNFRLFRVYKFRTMRVDAPQSLVSRRDDPRITSIGRFLRKTKIDELPQLWNVLRGEMSLVGPRPELPRYVEMFRDDYREILTVRPGMTDPASLVYRDEAAQLGASADPEREYAGRILPHKIRLSREYLRHASARRDLALILRTLLAR